MNRVSFGYNSIGTLHGTVNNYDCDGVLVSAQNLNGYGIFFSVADKWHPPDNILFQKTVGAGITIGTGTVSPCGSAGHFTVTFSSANLAIPPGEYLFNCYINSAGTTYTDGTSPVRSIGSGIFEVSYGFKP